VTTSTTSSAHPSSAAAEPARERTAYAPGARIEVRGMEWLVRTARPVGVDGTMIEALGVDELVRDQIAVFFDRLDKVTPLRPEETVLVGDDTPRFRRSRLYLESVLRRTPLPRSQRGLAMADGFLMDRKAYQQRPAELALAGAQPRVLIADVVGLGKTLEIGLLLAELIRRGRGERILVITPVPVLEQFQHELWTRFAIPLVRLDSAGIERIQREIPAGRNPFTAFRRCIVSIDTLKRTGQYAHHLDQSRWDAVVIDESHNLISRGSQRNELARLLASRTDALILASATPHNGDTRSFAELIRLLDPTAIADPASYSTDDIAHLYLRRTKVSPEVRDETSAQWAPRGPSVPVRCTARPAEDAVLTEITSTWICPDDSAPANGNRLFPFVLLKSFLSSPPALLHTIDQRLTHQDLPQPERTALARLRDLAEQVGQTSAKLDALVQELKDLGVGPKSDTRVVVFSERVQTLEWLRQVLPARLGFTEAAAKKAVKVMHGGISDIEQQRLVEEFATTGDLRILITGDVASEGVNLHRACHHLVHFDVPWSLIRIEQRNGRIDRYGQTEQPQFRALLLVASNADPADDLFASGTVRDDRIVAEKLLAKEEEVHRTLGTVEAVTGEYLPDREERRLMHDLLRGRTTEQSLEHRATDDPDEDDPGDFRLLDELLGPVGDRPDAPPAQVEVPSLFASTEDFLDEALHEVFTRPTEELDLVRNDHGLSLDAPDDLRQRLSDLPRSYLDTLRTGAGRRLRLHLTFDRNTAQQSLTDARSSRSTLWPATHYLGDLHPVVDWLIDRVLLKLGRQQAPVLLSRIDSPAYLLQGV
jgi:ERCC4-related helicase